MSAPRGKPDTPLQELKVFHKTRLLQLGKEEMVELEIPLRLLASYYGNEWLLEEGECEIRVGASSRDIKANSKN